MTTTTLPDVLSPATRGIFEDVGYVPTCGEVECNCGGAIHKEGQFAIIVYKGRFMLITGGQQSGKTEVTTKKFQDNLNNDIRKWQPCLTPFYENPDRETPPGRCAQHPRTDPDTGREERGDFSHLRNRRCDPTLLYWLVGREYIMCEEEYNRTYQDFISLGYEHGKNLFRANKVDAPGWIEIRFSDENIPRLRIDVKSEARPDAAFSRVSPHGIMACEASQLAYSTYQLMNSRTIGKKAWMILSGTIEKAQPWYGAMGENWIIGDGLHQSFRLPTYTNTHLFPGGEKDPEIVRMKAENPDDFYMERIEGRNVPPEGLVFKEFNIAIHVQTDVRYIPGETVYIFQDPGFAGIHALEICHKIDSQYRVFAEFHESAAITKEVIYWCTQQDWWREHKELAIDPYYKDSHHAVESIAETWLSETGLVAADNRRMEINLADERLAQYLHVNTLTKQPGVVFSPDCVGIISEFGAIPSPHSPHGEILAYRHKTGDNGMLIGKHPDSEYCDGIRALEAGITFYAGLGIPRRTNAVTFRGGQPIPIRRGKNKLPHERLAKK